MSEEQSNSPSTAAQERRPKAQGPHWLVAHVHVHDQKHAAMAFEAQLRDASGAQGNNNWQRQHLANLLVASNAPDVVYAPDGGVAATRILASAACRTMTLTHAAATGFNVVLDGALRRPASDGTEVWHWRGYAELTKATRLYRAGVCVLCNCARAHDRVVAFGELAS